MFGGDVLVSAGSPVTLDCLGVVAELPFSFDRPSAGAVLARENGICASAHGCGGLARVERFGRCLLLFLVDEGTLGREGD